MKEKIIFGLSIISLQVKKLFINWITFAFICFSIFIAIIIVNYDSIKNVMPNKDWVKFFLDIVKIFLSTSLGAFTAFQIQKFQSNKKLEEEKYSSLLRTQATLICMRNILINIKQEYSPELFEGNEFYNIKKLVFKTNYPALEYKEIILALKKEDIQQLFYIENSEQRFIAATNLIYERNSLYNKFTDMVSDIGLKSVLWKPISDDLKSLTVPIPKLVNDAEINLLKNLNSLRDLIKKYYPKRMVLNPTDRVESD